jgi:hypothetical protein
MKALIGAAMMVAQAVSGSISQTPTRAPVLVELYTSEGCSSCPPADALLAALQHDQPITGAEIVPIGFHVDYFNNLGWKDAFSSASFTARQEDYSAIFGPDSVFTPQIIVDGRTPLVGSDSAGVRHAIASAAGLPHLSLHLEARASADTLRMTINLPAAPPDTEKIQVTAAITEDGLTSVVNRGENRGRALHHVAVARKLQSVGSLSREAAVVEERLQIGQGWRPESLKAVVWLQGTKTRHVYGAAVAAIVR